MSHDGRPDWLEGFDNSRVFRVLSLREKRPVPPRRMARHEGYR